MRRRRPCFRCVALRGISLLFSLRQRAGRAGRSSVRWRVGRGSRALGAASSSVLCFTATARPGFPPTPPPACGMRAPTYPAAVPLAVAHRRWCRVRLWLFGCARARARQRPWVAAARGSSEGLRMRRSSLLFYLAFVSSSLSSLFSLFSSLSFLPSFLPSVLSSFFFGFFFFFVLFPPPELSFLFIKMPLSWRSSPGRSVRLFDHNMPGSLPTTSRGCPQPQIAPYQDPCGYKSRANRNPTTAKTFEPVLLARYGKRPQRISGGASLAITNLFRVIVWRGKYGRIQQ